MLTEAVVERILTRIPSMAIGVLGDLFLDRYLDIDPALTERSIETGLDAYQVVDVRPSPGAAGTIINNLAALGITRIHAISVIGDDGEGYELRQLLKALGVVQSEGIFAAADRRTPTYTKPMLLAGTQPARELNRLDIKNRTELAPEAEQHVRVALSEAWPKVDALVVLDQMDKNGFGVVTPSIVQQLADFGQKEPGKLILADSRERIEMFRSVWLKPNQAECSRAVLGSEKTARDIENCVIELARRTARPVFCTRAEQGILVADPGPNPPWCSTVPAYPVEGPIDIVGAGDSTSAGIACAIAAGTTIEQAAAFGNLVASITIQQVGTTGTASPKQVRDRWREVKGIERSGA